MVVPHDPPRPTPNRQSTVPSRASGHRCPGCSRYRVTRRAVLGGLAAAGITSFAGCLSGGGEDEVVPDPVALDGGKQCDVCGMVIADHPGPNGQTFYRDHSPETHANPAWFDSPKEQFAYHFEKQRSDWEAVVLYATDYSAVDYSLSTEQGTTYISCHVAPESFADAADLVFVVGSGVHGAMGSDLIPFSEEDDAIALAADYGGQVVAFEDIDEGTLAR